MSRTFPSDLKSEFGENSCAAFRARTRLQKHVLRCIYTALALCLCCPAYADDIERHGSHAGPSAAPVAADNSARNERDRDSATLTPMDQSNEPNDIARSAEIRKALMADQSLGVNGHNIKVITIGGHVTLRGPVDSQADLTRIGDIAGQIAGSENVTNELELTAP